MNSFAGKTYAEIERAHLIKKLAKIKEEQGLIAEAADIMQEVAEGKDVVARAKTGSGKTLAKTELGSTRLCPCPNLVEEDQY